MRTSKPRPSSKSLRFFRFADNHKFGSLQTLSHYDQQCSAIQESQKHLEDRAKELSDIMATVLAKYDEAVAHQQLMDADDQAEELEEDKPLPEFTTKRFDPNEERFDPALDLTSLFRVRQSPHTQRKALHKKVGPL